MDDRTTEWIDAKHAPAYVGWYEVQKEDGSISRFWHGPIWWAMLDPSCGFDTNLICAPGVCWRGLRKPLAGVNYQLTAGIRDHAVAHRILRTGR